ncbi:WD_REPEATS_REGION domain-containing protein, partial [Mortierella sp. GBA35]
MTPSEQEEQTGYSGPTTPSSAQGGSIGLEGSLHLQSEHDLHRLKTLRLSERDNALYIPPQAKPTLQSSDDTLFPLMEKALDFIASPRQVLLLLGDSGGGKSTFNLQLERTLWERYKAGDPIPLHINLPTIDNPLQDMTAKQLQRLGFSDSQIQELKRYRQFIVICDGYDESQFKENLYAVNQLNRPGQWRAKVVISCRIQYLGPDYRSQFQPIAERYEPAVAADLLQEVVIASFTRSQIQQYVEQYVQRGTQCAVDPIQPSWSVEDYMDKLLKIPKLIELVSNPFLLTLALRALPKV